MSVGWFWRWHIQLRKDCDLLSSQARFFSEFPFKPFLRIRPISKPLEQHGFQEMKMRSVLQEPSRHIQGQRD